ncbi:hypothetical protein UB44_05220 [Burkholderiaceae bacterium 26]|nr:hypothetical protein UB44_05220 [Burkholderiaceae bacterium 26]
MQLEIIAAIETFEAWNQPWTFLEAVKAWPTLIAADRTTLQQIWIEACDARHWQHADNGQNAAAADLALQERFPWLPDHARAQFVRAASFEWK